MNEPREIILQKIKSLVRTQKVNQVSLSEPPEEFQQLHQLLIEHERKITIVVIGILQNHQQFEKINPPTQLEEELFLLESHVPQVNYRYFARLKKFKEDLDEMVSLCNQLIEL